MRLYKGIRETIVGYSHSRKALRYAAKKGIPGLQFGQYGQQLGLRLLRKRLPGARGYLLTPVSITRYFEFDFVLDNLPAHFNNALDISSPRLFSCYVAEKGLAKSVTIMNPDINDAQITEKIAAGLHMKNVSVTCTDVKGLAANSQTYDCIWSISVIEHISGVYDDTSAIKTMYNALNEGGRLILTFPVDRHFWEEYREGQDPYGTQEKQGDNRYFFQRFYDPESIYQRLLNPIGVESINMRWFGETTAGHFHDYIQKWLQEGVIVTTEDPREIADYYQEFDTWEEMPGAGVCGISIQK